MELTYFLAQLFGITMMIVAVSALIRPELIYGVFDGLMSNAALMLYFGITAIVVGLAIVLNHNYWVADWPVIITLFGWGALLKGVMYLAAPQTLLGIGGSMYSSANRIKLTLVICFVFGAFLVYKGFGF